MLLPGLLRETGTAAPISFFLHTPWPPPELFTRLPWRRQILHGLLGADIVSFHTERYRKNFLHTCGRVLADEDVRVSGHTVRLADGRQVRTVANPISIDSSEFAALATSDDVDTKRNRLELQIPRSAGATRRGSPGLHQGNRRAITGRINGRFTEPGHDVPVHYLHRGVSREHLIAYYCHADIMLVTPLKDGMNLVAKEFVVCQSAVGGSGALVLSEFAGASLELREAQRCNPFDVEGLSRVIESAIDTGADVRRESIRAMDRRIREADVHRWARRELQRAQARSAA